MPTTPTNFEFLDAPEHIGSEYDHVRKALKLYVKVIEALEARDDKNTYSPLVNERFQRVLHFMNENFYDPNSGGMIGNSDPLYTQAMIEVRKMFYGVAADGNPVTYGKNGNGPAVEHGWDYTQRMWSLPPELLEPTIAICIARDFLSCRKGKFRPTDGITVRGKEVNPWKGFAARYCSLILEA